MLGLWNSIAYEMGTEPDLAVGMVVSAEHMGTGYLKEMFYRLKKDTDVPVGFFITLQGCDFGKDKEDAPYLKLILDWVYEKYASGDKAVEIQDKPYKRLSLNIRACFISCAASSVIFDGLDVASLCVNDVDSVTLRNMFVGFWDTNIDSLNIHASSFSLYSLYLVRSFVQHSNIKRVSVTCSEVYAPDSEKMQIMESICR